MGRGAPRGELALVLHTHMPYVEGFGTWPFGEEWLWEAMATCYLPLLEVLAREAPLTLSLTPVLADQLEAPGIGERFTAFLDDVRAETHRQDIEGSRAGAPEIVPELEHSAADYRSAGARFEAIGGDLLGALVPHAAWTSAATHAVLPLLAADAGVSLQLEVGIASHRRRSGGWGGGLWLPECAHAPWLDPLLDDAGVRATCVDLTDVLGRGAAAQLRPLRGEHGPTLLPIDRATMELVWSDAGYPAHGSYRDYHRHTIHHHRPWAIDGSLYDREAAAALAREHAREFVAAVIARLDAAAAELGRPGLCVCPLDTELLGHWWHEGLTWLEAVLDEAAAQGLELAALDEALTRHEPAPLPSDELPVTTWGTPRDLRTWDGPAVADFAWRARAAELRTLGGGGRGWARSPRALRELLALQSSDWAFMVSRGLAGDYPRERATGHAAALDAALAGEAVAAEPALRHLAPDLGAA
ncbi:MAG: 1,4-alpha-glucan branching protein domain-containing protein [Solirubrobacteraceae bacterium]